MKGSAKKDSMESPRKNIALVAPVPPPNGGMAMQAGKLAERLRAEGLSVSLIATNPDFPAALKWCAALPGVRTFIRFWLYLFRLRALRSVDVVHIFACSHLYFFISVVPALLVGRWFRCRVLVNYRGGEADRFFARWGWLVGFYLKRVDAVVVPSPFLQEVFRQRLDIEAAVLPNIADAELFAFRDRSVFEPVFVVSRQLEPIYGHEVILRAFARVRQELPAARLKIAGGGSLRQPLEEMVVREQIEGVEFYGTVDHQQLAEIYAASAVMVNASLADNFPGALMEAFLCGLPVVTSDVGGISCMVEHRRNGLLVKPHDDAALAAGMLELVQDPALARALAKEGYAYARQYRWEQIRERIFALYFGDGAS